MATDLPEPMAAEVNSYEAVAVGPQVDAVQRDRVVGCKRQPGDGRRQADGEAATSFTTGDVGCGGASVQLVNTRPWAVIAGPRVYAWGSSAVGSSRV